MTVDWRSHRETKVTLSEKSRGKKKIYMSTIFFGISASFFGEQEWEKLLEG